MAGAARSKIDRQTMQMFDAEVDVPQHDTILTTLFNSDERLKAMICKLHGVGPLVQPKPDQEIAVIDLMSDSRVGSMSYQSAVGQIEGPPPTWTTSDPVREFTKKIEAPLYFHVERSTRILGFADLLLTYWVPGPLQIIHDLRDRERPYRWHVQQRRFYLVAEVKSKWPTAGNLLRQLNLYSICVPNAHGNPLKVVVGPDDTMLELLHAHGWRLVCFDQALSAFRLCPKPNAPPKQPPPAKNAF